MIRIFYHTDLDGHAAGAIVKTVHPEAKMYPINYGYGFPWDDIKKDDTVYMVDFALQPFSDMVRLKEMCKEFIWVDHHKTSLNEAVLNSFTTPGLRQDGVAGCELTWTYLFPDKHMPVAIKLLGAYDIWDHSDPSTLPFQYGMRIKETDPGKDMTWWNMLMKQTSSPYIEEIVSDGETILAYEEMTNASLIKSYGFETLLPVDYVEDGRKRYRVYQAIVVNRGNGSSKIFDSVWNAEKYHLMITFCRLPSRKWTVSLYSTREDVDCGAIAKIFGGGGHKGAAGWQCEELPFSY